MHGLFVSCISCALFFLGQMPHLNTVQWSETFVGRFERFARPARHLYFRVLWRQRKPVRSIGNIPKQQKIIRSWLQNAFVKRPTWHNALKSAQSSSAFGQRPSTTFCPKTLWASFLHHHESVYKVGRNTDQDVLRYPAREYKERSVYIEKL